jgi:hypothetical protein
MSMPLIDVISICGVLFTFVIYYGRYAFIALKYGTTSDTQLGRSLDTAVLWAQKHAEVADAGSVVLAVQTLRNVIVVAIFVGGAALQVAISGLENKDMNWSSNEDIDKVRTLIKSVLLICSFLNWSMVIRYASHAGFMVGALDIRMRTLQNISDNVNMNINQQHEPIEIEINEVGDAQGSAVHLDELDEQDVDELLQEPVDVTNLKRASRLVSWHFSWGFRFIFFNIPFFFYAAGVVALIISALFTMMFLIYFDDPILHVPSNKNMFKSDLQSRYWGNHRDSPALRHRKQDVVLV